LINRAKLLINGASKKATGGAVFERRSPITSDVVTTAAAATNTDATSAANAAAAAFPDWSQTGPQARRTLLSAAAAILTRRADEFTEIMIAETGSARGWGTFNTHLAANILKDAAAMTTQIQGEVVPSDEPGKWSMAIRQPAGVCLGIAPWNAPIILGVRAIAMPLACANTVILKASEHCPMTHCLIGQVMQEAGFPDGVVNVITNAPADSVKIVETLISHAAVRRINFTGSTRIGRMVAETSARNLKRCLLELGGKAPFLVLADADVPEAAKAAAFGSFINQGQTCMSTERIIVVDSIADDFVQELKIRAEKLLAGTPDRPLGAMMGGEAARRVKTLIEDAVQKGAVVVCGGDVRGAMMDATIIDDVTPAMRMYRQECFGPVAAILRVGSTDEAITVANDNEYGLAAAVFSTDVSEALKVAARIESGICHINSATVADEPQVPFGGVKSSGYGRFGGKAAIDEFTELRWISVSELPRDYPL
jgi:acyl-CoA reductase-like NAD-dependent aldehyde dehydrogenase